MIMAIDFEKIKSASSCPDCKNKNLALGYSNVEAGLYTKSTFLGMDALQPASDTIYIICKNCGLIIKEYAQNPEKL